MTIESQTIDQPHGQDTSVALPLAVVLFFAAFLSLGMLTIDTEDAPGARVEAKSEATVATN